jgi:ribonuclease HI
VSKTRKYYVVWEGSETGVFTSWDACKKAISGYSGAKYKSFTNLAQAEFAFEGVYEEYIGKNSTSEARIPNELSKFGLPNMNSIAVDAACSGNPGVMEYRGLDLVTSEILFAMGPFEQSTNNVGEFLALVHALALMKKRGDRRPIYTDSKIAIGWMRGKRCLTKLPRTGRNMDSFILVDRAEKWLRDNQIQNPVVKWETKAWGEIPADFGRK